MSNRTRAATVCSLSLLAVGLLGAAVWATAQDEPKRQGIAPFMRAKLDYSKDVLEGLATADYKKIADGARALRDLTEQERWRVSPEIRYVRYTEEFERLTEDMEAAARKENIDGATLAYVNLTINCVNCHKFVRDQRLTGADVPIRLR